MDIQRHVVEQVSRRYRTEITEIFSNVRAGNVTRALPLTQRKISYNWAEH